MATNARELFQAGRLTEAVQALGAEVRDHPTDARRRTFLFELLCFSGAYDRAEKHLDILAEANKEAGMGALLYRGALHAEKLRRDLFEKKEYPKPDGQEPRSVRGTLNGKPFESLEDTDTRIGARLEVFAAGDYLWIPYEHIRSLSMEEPKRLRDLLWTPARLQTGPAFQDKDLGEVLLPVLAPLSAQSADDAVRLGRVTVWEEDEAAQQIPLGQKMLLVDGEEIPLLEIRSLEISGPAAGS